MRYACGSRTHVASISDFLSAGKVHAQAHAQHAARLQSQTAMLVIVYRRWPLHRPVILLTAGFIHVIAKCLQWTSELQQVLGYGQLWTVVFAGSACWNIR
jgi:hypothetical protein